MSEEPENYSNPEDKVNYQVIKSSHGRVNRASARNSMYFFVALIIIIVFGMMVFFQALKIGVLERRITNLETKVTNIESQLQKLQK